MQNRTELKFMFRSIFTIPVLCASEEAWLLEELHTMHVVLLINSKKQFSESMPGMKYLGIALDGFFSSVICLRLLISSSIFQGHTWCICMLLQKLILLALFQRLTRVLMAASNQVAAHNSWAYNQTFFLLLLSDDQSWRNLKPCWSEHSKTTWQ